MLGDLRDKWIYAIHQYQSIENLQVFTYLNVCSLHFAATDVLKSKKLRKGAVPTIFFDSQNEQREERDTGGNANTNENVQQNMISSSNSNDENDGK